MNIYSSEKKLCTYYKNYGTWKIFLVSNYDKCGYSLASLICLSSLGEDNSSQDKKKRKNILISEEKDVKQSQSPKNFEDL